MCIRLACLLLCCGLLSAADETVRFNLDIRPILSDKCFACHGPDESKRSTAQRFDKPEAAQKAVVAGQPDESLLYQRISSNDEAKRMPPAYQGHDKLPEKDIALVRRWIEQGAEWEGHWAFIPPERSATEDIDSLVRAKLEPSGLRPAPEADRARLIRRVSLDLTGLPPTSAEVDAFVNDSSANAYAKVVDRLLSSPAYGERMAFRWLDAARYADTNGYQNDQERYMWRWRDWVIDAFNRNMPFDQFTIEQIAGDLLPNSTLEQKIASGFNRNHRGNGENGTDPREYHVEYVVDRVETTSTVWLGLTLGCARCHDHKFDPFTQKEFYQFYAYFNNVPDRGRYFKYGNTPPLVRAPTASQRRQLDGLEGRIRTAERKLTSEEASIARQQRKWEKRGATTDWSFDERLVVSHDLAELDGSSEVDLGDIANFNFYDRFTLAAWIKPRAPTGGILSRYTPTDADGGDRGYGLFLVDGKLQLKIVTASIDDRVIVETIDSVPLGVDTHVAATYDGTRLARGMRIYINGVQVPQRVIIDHSLNDTTNDKEPLRIGHGPRPDDRFKGQIREARVYDRTLSTGQVEILAVADTPAELAGMAGRSDAQNAKLRAAFLDSAARAKIREAWAGLRRMNLEREALIDSFPTVMVMGELDKRRETNILIRGAFDAPGERVERGLPKALPGEAPDRLALARWIVDRGNPLTARVIVNRFWQTFFGTGIVSTVEDFGSQGEWPTHPELLDWLAVEFMESGWDVKGILKTIVMSQTYRQDSRLTPEGLEQDPQNRLLSRGPRIRLPAEAVRDQALAAAGLLTAKVGGPSVKPYQPAGLWTELTNWKAYEASKGEDLYRRSLYTFWKRTVAPPAMLTFDSAPRESCVVLETRTNTPLQALNLMNDVTYVEAARKLAERMMNEGGESPAERLDYGFRLAAAREPGEAEREILRRSLNRYFDRFQTTPADAEQILSAGESPRNENLEPAEHAAYAAVASMILNLDETVTKQ